MEKKLSIIVLTLLILALYGCSSVSCYNYGRIAHVDVIDHYNFTTVINFLNIHCRSKNNDLGPQILGPGSYYKYHFKTNVWGTTLFSCKMSWVNKQNTLIEGEFVNYDFSRDREKCGHECNYYIDEQGVTYYNPSTKEKQLMYSWS